MSAAPATAADELPEDLRWPAGLVRASLKAQIDVARSDLHRWIQINEPRSRREYGEGSMAITVYRAGVQARLSVIHSLLELQQQQNDHQETPA